MSLEKLLENEHMRSKLERSWCAVDRNERKTRLQAIIRLSSELERVRQISPFAAGIAETVLEYIIEGDWEAAVKFVRFLTFSNEAEAMREQYAPLWEPFVVITQTMYAEAARRGPTLGVKAH
jgi:hypothetical protein